MMWGKGDLAYIPSNARLQWLNFESVDFDEEGKPYSMGVDYQKELEFPSFGIVLDHEPYLDMRKLFIANAGVWYVCTRDLYEPRRTENEIPRSNTRERHARG